MRKIRFIIPLICTLSYLCSQENIGTIKIKKEQNLVKVVFDNTEYRLFAIDRFGNPKENEIVSYMFWIKGSKNFKAEGFSNKLTPEMIKELKKQKKAAKIFFTQIKVKTDEQHIIDMPDIIETWFPECRNCIEKKK